MRGVTGRARFAACDKVPTPNQRATGAPRDAKQVREVRVRPGSGRPRVHLQLRMHLLTRVHHNNGPEVPELRWRTGAAATTGRRDMMPRHSSALALLSMVF